MIAELSPVVVGVAVFAYVLGGIGKGVTGGALQAITVPTMALVVPLEVAIGLAIVPTAATSLWQVLTGNAIWRIARRFWSVMIPCCVSIWAGVYLLATADRTVIVVVLGGVLCTYATYALASPRLPQIGRREVWLSPVIGSATGLAGGATGMFVMPVAPYMQLLGLKRDDLVQVASLQTLVYPLMLGLALGRFDLFEGLVQVTSLGLLIPTFIGLAIGTSIRRRISEARFRRVFTWTLMALGVTIVLRTLIAG